MRARGEVVADARLRGREASQAQIDAAQRVLEHAPSAKTVVGLSRLPVGDRKGKGSAA